MSPNALVAGYAGILIVLAIIYLLLLVFQIVCMWVLYDKAGQPGWAAIIPVYATIIRQKVSGKPMSWVIWFMQFWIFYFLYLFTREPFAALLYVFSAITNLVFYIMMLNGISRSFGKDSGYTVGLLFLPFVFFPILAFGDSKYIGPDGIAPSIDELLS